jgi:hypothetical protein
MKLHKLGKNVGGCALILWIVPFPAMVLCSFLEREGYYVPWCLLILYNFMFLAMTCTIWGRLPFVLIGKETDNVFALIAVGQLLFPGLPVFWGLWSRNPAIAVEPFVQAFGKTLFWSILINAVLAFIWPRLPSRNR